MDQRQRNLTGKAANRKNGPPQQTQIRLEVKMQKYPWDQWFARKKRYRLIKGRDFDCKPSSMNVLARNAAKARGLRVSISMEADDKLIPYLLVENLGTI